MTIKLLGVSGSLRERSFHSALLRNAADLLLDDATLTIANIHDIPLYNSDLGGPPESVQRFKQQIAEADGMLLASPEYNHSISGVLKNAIDWASRQTPGQDRTVLSEKPVAFLHTATGAFGGVRAHEHLIQIAHAVNMRIVSRPAIIIPFARDKFDDDLTLIDATTREFIQKMLNNLVSFIRREKG